MVNDINMVWFLTSCLCGTKEVCLLLVLLIPQVYCWNCSCDSHIILVQIEKQTKGKDITRS